MKPMQVQPRRNGSLIDIRNNKSSIITAFRSPSPIVRRESPPKFWNQPQRNFNLPIKKISTNALKELIMPATRQQHSPQRYRQGSQFTTVMPVVKTIVKVIRQPCCHRNHSPQRMYKTMLPQHISIIKVEQSQGATKQKSEEEAPIHLKNDSLYTNTYNSPKDSFSIPVLQDESSVEGSRQKPNLETTHNNSRDPLEECITSLEQRVEMLMRDGSRNKSQLLMRLVHQGSKYSQY